eukprot:CAMPEP_0172627350 /NCGR_PEP_ID=MMETSP1068-20121228/155725_1 /TAXON_ID=35684 /ORGANISM="Pseudopedinella elastica, Strain CCMP716" /LENGTH=335 /DNA_ID=CAMNT_0013437207 /DNA_START=84 /DNA_END=1087 /DNA_ORIENTATION=+
MPENLESERWLTEESPIEERWDGIVTMTDGKVEGYDLARVLRGGFFRVNAPVFTHPFVLWQTATVFGLSVVLAATLVVSHVTNLAVVDSKLVDQTADAYVYVGALSGFLFGFFIFDQLSTFLNIKNNLLGGFWGYFQDLMSLTGAWWPDADQNTHHYRKTLVRWGVATFTLCCTKASGKPKEETLAHALNLGLLTGPEATLVMKMGGDPVIPLLWMYDALVARIRKEHGSDGRRAGFKVKRVESLVLGMRGRIGGIIVAVSSFGLPPLPLVHLMSALVKLQLFLLALKEGVFIADVIVGDAVGKTPQICFALLMTVATPIIFQSLLEFVIMIRNP